MFNADDTETLFEKQQIVKWAANRTVEAITIIIDLKALQTDI
jgi:hypothetical protein